MGVERFCGKSWSDPFRAQRAGFPGDDLAQVGMLKREPVKIFNKARVKRPARFHLKNGLSKVFPKVPKVLDRRRKLRRGPPVLQPRRLRLRNQVSGGKPPRQGAAVG